MSRPRDPAPSPGYPWALGVGRADVFQGTRRIESFFEQLGRLRPGTRRQIVDVPNVSSAVLAQKAVLFRQADGSPLAEQPLSKRPRAFLADTYGTVGVDIRTDSNRWSAQAYVVSLPLQGQVDYHHDGQRCSVPAQAGAVFDQTLLEGLRCTPDFHFLEFSVLQHDLTRLARDCLPGLGAHQLRPRPVLSGEMAQRMLFMAVQAAQALEQGEACGNTLLFQRWYDLIGLSLLSEQLEAGHAAKQTGRQALTPASLRRATDFIHAHAAEPLALADVADAACVSVSCLLRQFKLHVGMTPHAFIQAARLDRARQDLKKAPNSRVRDVALRWGFQNASKFSQAYQRRFGELPRETLRS